MKRVTGIGGVFFKADDPDKLYEWYEKHLGVKQEAQGQGVQFSWKTEDGRPGMTVWSLFPRDTKYFDPSKTDFMINYRVDDLEALVAALESEGIAILGREDYDYGRFAWIMDPEGHRIELWEPR